MKNVRLNFSVSDPIFHLLNIILEHNEIHATKSFGLQPAMMLMIHHKRQIFPLQASFELCNKTGQLLTII